MSLSEILYACALVGKMSVENVFSEKSRSAKINIHFLLVIRLNRAWNHRDDTKRL